MSAKATAEPKTDIFLKQFLITNYRCFKSVDVPLKPLTVVIGPNDTGKSLFLLGLQKLARNLTSFDPPDHYRDQPGLLVRLELRNTIGSQWISNREVGTSNVFDFGPVEIFHLPALGVAMKSTGYADAQAAAPALVPDGANVAGLIDYFLRRDRPRFENCIGKLKEFIPGLEDIQVATPSPQERQIDLVVDGRFRIPADRASAGLRLLIFFVSLAYHPTLPRLILLEEPENGIHPRRLADVMKLLREITRGLHGTLPAQVVLTTHSPYLLDHVDIDQDQVLVSRRAQDGSREVVPVDAPRLKVFLDEFKLGEVWFNEGEDRLCAKSG